MLAVFLCNQFGEVLAAACRAPPAAPGDGASPSLQRTMQSRPRYAQACKGLLGLSFGLPCEGRPLCPGQGQRPVKKSYRHDSRSRPRLHGRPLERTTARDSD
jgi:hypothetical protein